MTRIRSNPHFIPEREGESYIWGQLGGSTLVEHGGRDPTAAATGAAATSSTPWASELTVLRGDPPSSQLSPPATPRPTSQPSLET